MTGEEAALQRYLIRTALARGMYARKVVAVGRTGFPDVLLAFAGRIYLVEVKNPSGRGRVSAKQKSEHAHLKRAGVDVRVIANKGEVDDYIDDIIASADG